MMEGDLPDNVIVAFTGDEEEESGGAIEVTRLLTKKNVKFKCIVLDVTNEGWELGSDFTVENNFWDKEMGEKVIETVGQHSSYWRFVPSDPDDVPGYVKREFVEDKEAEPDESWDYGRKPAEIFEVLIKQAEYYDIEDPFKDGCWWVYERSTFESYVSIYNIDLAELDIVIAEKSDIPGTVGCYQDGDVWNLYEVGKDRK